MFSNVQSIVKKIDELRAYVVGKEPDVVILTETWTNGSISDDYLKIKSYEMVAREDRKDTMAGRGGILVYARKELSVWRGEEKDKVNQLVEIKVGEKGNEITIYAVYRSPNSKEENNARLVEWTKSVKGRTIAVGDFNYPGIDWEKGRSDARGRPFYEACCDQFVEQHVKGPTHISGNCLDLVLCSEEIIEEVSLDGRLGSSDHEIVWVTVNQSTKKRKMCSQYRDYCRADYREARRMMGEIRWEEELEGKNVNQMWELLRSKIEEVVQECVPLRNVRSKNQPGWYCRELKQMSENKRRAWDCWKKSKTETDKQKYKQLEIGLKRTIRNKKRNMEKKVAQEAKTNPKAFFAYINGNKRMRNKIGPLMREENGVKEIIVEPRRQAEVLNEWYASVFTKGGGESPKKEPVDGTKELSEVTITEERVKGLIEKMKEKSAPGPDGITNKLMKELVREIAKPLTKIFRKSMDEAKIPDDWRKSNITPIYKGGSKATPANYRPVNLTSNVGKLMERIVKEDIESHLESENLMEESQHGFRRGRSAQTNLVEFLDQTTKWVDEGEPFDIVYYDFAKAFDKVSHKSLLVKIRAVGIQGKLLKWIEDWLKDRLQRVVVEGEESDWRRVLSSVIQGSVLGGTFFDIYIGHIDNGDVSLVIKFADDTKMARVVKTRHDADELQKDIDKFSHWASKWEMEFNVKKCKVLHVGHRNPRCEYQIDGVRLEVVEEEKDLGVVVASDMKPSRQCEKAAKGANAMLGMITRSFHYRSKDTLVPLFKTFVRPRLEFSVAAWSPWMQKDVDVLEKVQKRMARMVSDVRGASYEERMEEMKLTTLMERRLRGDMVEVYKTMRGFN